MTEPADTLRAAALRLLARREYSRAELSRKLAPLAGEEEGEARLQSLLDTLQSERLLSDERYARQRVVARSRRYGNRRLTQELRQQGVSDEAIGEALAEGDSELARCRAVQQKKFGELPNSPETLAKQTRFLQYRGFSSDAIRQTLRESDA